MAWKGLHLTEPARLDLADSQLGVHRENSEIRLPLEDLAFVILDTPRVTLTTALLATCMEAGLALLITDTRHTPSGLALPFHRHHRQAAVASLQTGCSAALKKRLWQALVVAKIRNQAAVLEELGRDGFHGVSALAQRVGSGDPDNVEARAARDYWRHLFPDFRRDDGNDWRNLALNYGYAVVRACVARAVVACGLVPALGLFHASTTNAFNLADDLIEPFRPWVDRLVWQIGDRGCRHEGELERADRQILAGLAMAEVRIGPDTVSLLVAAEQAAESLVRALETGSAALLTPPALEAKR